MFLQINDVRMFVNDSSASDFETILFIHGFPFDHSMWREQIYLLGTEFRCIAPDLRGHGGTLDINGPRPPEQVTIDLLADDLIALIEQRQPRDRRITLCGLSMGGYIAFALWRKIPERIGRLVLADTKATPDTPETRAKRQAQAEKVNSQGTRAISDAMLDTLLTPEHRSSSVGMEVRRMIESTSPQGVINTLHALANRPDSTDTLATITVPTLVMVGEHDKLTTLDDARYMHQRLRHSAPLAVIPDAAHVSALENGAAFNRALLDFLRVRA
jgi:pimeloyl-ACP methyl ester carboxylesterase